MSKHNKKNTLSVLEDIATTFCPLTEKIEDEENIVFPALFPLPARNENELINLVYNKNSETVTVAAMLLEVSDIKKFTDCLYMVNELNRAVSYVTFSYVYEENAVFVGRDIIAFNNHHITHDDVLAAITSIIAPIDSFREVCQAFIDGKVLREILPLALSKAHNAYTVGNEEEDTE